MRGTREIDVRAVAAGAGVGGRRPRPGSVGHRPRRSLTQGWTLHPHHVPFSPRSVRLQAVVASTCTRNKCTTFGPCHRAAPSHQEMSKCVPDFSLTQRRLLACGVVALSPLASRVPVSRAVARLALCFWQAPPTAVLGFSFPADLLLPVDTACEWNRSKFTAGAVAGHPCPSWDALGARTSDTGLVNWQPFGVQRTLPASGRAGTHVPRSRQ